MNNYLYEFIGTTMMILLGFGTVANVNLEKTWMKGSGPLAIVFGWAFAVGIPVAIFGGISGAHFNPAVTLAMWVDSSIGMVDVIGYIVAQCLGVAAGSLLIYIIFKEQLDATEDGNTTKGVFCTAPTSRNFRYNFLSEFIGTFILVTGVKGTAYLGDLTRLEAGVWLFMLLCAIALSFGGLTGYAINPARDNISRLVYSFLPIKHKANPDFKYAIVSITGPILGAISAVLVFNLLPF